MKVHPGQIHYFYQMMGWRAWKISSSSMDVHIKDGAYAAAGRLERNGSGVRYENGQTTATVDLTTEEELALAALLQGIVTRVERELEAGK